MLPKQMPDPSIRVSSSGQNSDKPKPSPLMAHKRHKHNVVPTTRHLPAPKAVSKQLKRLPMVSSRKSRINETVINKRQASTIKSSPVASVTKTLTTPVGQCIKRSGDSQELPFKCTERGHKLVNEQSQTSLSPREVGERRHIHVVIKINEVIDKRCSPEPYTTITLPDPLFTPMLHPSHSAVGSTSRLTNEQGNNDVNRDKEESVKEHSPEDLVAPALPARMPVLATQTVPLHQPRNEALSPIGTMPEQHSLFVINSKCLASEERLPESKTARKQSEETSSRGVEGGYLSQAAAYMRERLGKRLSACNMFPLREDRRPQPKVVEVGARQHKGDISERITNKIKYPPYTKVAPTLPILPLAHSIWPNPYHKPSCEPRHTNDDHCDHDFPSTSRRAAMCSLAPPEGVHQWHVQEAINTKMTSTCRCSPEASEVITESTQEQRGHKDIRKMDEATLIPCSPRAESSGPSTSGSPASTNNGLIIDKVISQLSFQATKAQKDEEEMLVEADEEPKNAGWPGQGSNNKTMMSTCLCSPKTSVAHPTSEPR
jgi:hypothetical protein